MPDCVTLSGLLALSGYLPLHTALPTEFAPANQATPVLMMHGTVDAVVPHGMGMASAELLQESGFNLAWQEYPMGHQVCAEQIDDIGQWLATRLCG